MCIAVVLSISVEPDRADPDFSACVFPSSLILPYMPISVLRALRARVCFFFHPLDLLSVSNNWTGPHSALSHGHTSPYLRLPAFTCLLLVCLACLPAWFACLPACLPTISPPLVHSRCIHSLVSHRYTCISSYIARMPVRNNAHVVLDTRTTVVRKRMMMMMMMMQPMRGWSFTKIKLKNKMIFPSWTRYLRNIYSTSWERNIISDSITRRIYKYNQQLLNSSRPPAHFVHQFLCLHSQREKHWESTALYRAKSQIDLSLSILSLPLICLIGSFAFNCSLRRNWRTAVVLLFKEKINLLHTMPCKINCKALRKHASYSWEFRERSIENLLVWRFATRVGYLWRDGDHEKLMFIQKLQNLRYLFRYIIWCLCDRTYIWSRNKYQPIIYVYARDYALVRKCAWLCCE